MTGKARALNRFAWGMVFVAGTFSAATGMAQTPAPDTSQAPAAVANTRNVQMVAARAELAKTLDAKKAKAGDPVTLKLNDSAKTSPELPKGAELTGHIDSVQASESKGDSTIVITLDKAQPKGGQPVSIKATIIKVIPFNNPLMQQNQTGPQQTPGLGSAPGSASGTTPGGGMDRPAGIPAPNVAANPGGTNETTQQQSGVNDQMAAAPGVDLHSDIHDKTSGTFTSKGKNVHVIGGTQFEVAIAVMSPQ